MRKFMNIWKDDNVQFTRLLAEIRAVGLTGTQLTQLSESMDLDKDDIVGLMKRAECAWELLKEQYLEDFNRE